MQKYNMKLNPLKCVFGVNAGKFLGFMMTQRWIEVNPTQVKAVFETPAHSQKKKMQRLTSRLVALGQFIALFTGKLYPFFTTVSRVCMFG